MDRRDFIGSSLVTLGAASTAALAGSAPASGSPASGASEAGGSRSQPGASAIRQSRDWRGVSRLGWELGTQAWTFRDRSCFEAIDTAQRLGLTCMELFPGQKMTAETTGSAAELKVGPGMTASQRSELKGKLSSAGVKALTFGVVNPSNDEKAAREIFEFVKDMGMVGIACEPARDAWGLVAKLSAEHQIHAACHNHPNPSTYWDPMIVRESIDPHAKTGLDRYIGACADTGHWVRSGLDTVECLRKYEGRIIELHFKDVKEDLDRPWGTGAGNAHGQMIELKRQGFTGPIYVEYEHGSGVELEKNVAASIAFFDRVAHEIA
jgi:sugar phosphate isomerase/epimerase